MTFEERLEEAIRQGWKKIPYFRSDAGRFMVMTIVGPIKLNINDDGSFSIDAGVNTLVHYGVDDVIPRLPSIDSFQGTLQSSQKRETGGNQMKLFIFHDVTVSTRYCGGGSWIVVAQDREHAQTLLVRAVEACDKAFAEDEEPCLRPWDSDLNYWGDVVAKAEHCLTLIPEQPVVNVDELRKTTPAEYELADKNAHRAIYQFPNAGCE